MSTQSCNSSFFYIKPQHPVLDYDFSDSCNSSFFYIKPQQIGGSVEFNQSCNSSFFYIKPQLSEVDEVFGIQL